MATRKKTDEQEQAPQFIPSHPLEQRDPDVDAAEAARREAEKREFLAAFAKTAPAVQHVVADLVESVEEVAQRQVIAEDVALADSKAGALREELAALAGEQAELQRQEQARIDAAAREFELKRADLERRRAVAEAVVRDAQQRQALADMKSHADRIEQERVRADAVLKASQDVKNLALKDRIAPRISALGHEKAALNALDLTGLRGLAEGVAPRTWAPHLQSKWRAEVQSVAAELLSGIAHAKSQVRRLVAEGEAIIARGHLTRADFALEVNTLLRDAGRSIGLAKAYKDRLSMLSNAAARISGFVQNYKGVVVPTAPDTGRAQLAAEAKARMLTPKVTVQDQAEVKPLG